MQGHRSQPEIWQVRATTTALSFSIMMLFLFNKRNDGEGRTVELGWLRWLAGIHRLLGIAHLKIDKPDYQL